MRLQGRHVRYDCQLHRASRRDAFRRQSSVSAGENRDRDNEHNDVRAMVGSSDERRLEPTDQERHGGGEHTGEGGGREGPAVEVEAALDGRGDRQAPPTVASCTVVSRTASWRGAIEPRKTRWAANATAHPSVSTSPRPKPLSAPPVSRTSPATASTTPTSVSGCGGCLVVANEMKGTNTTSM